MYSWCIYMIRCIVLHVTQVPLGSSPSTSLYNLEIIFKMVEIPTQRPYIFLLVMTNAHWLKCQTSAIYTQVTVKACGPLDLLLESVCTFILFLVICSYDIKWKRNIYALIIAGWHFYVVWDFKISWVNAIEQHITGDQIYSKSFKLPPLHFSIILKLWFTFMEKKLYLSFILTM